MIRHETKETKDMEDLVVKAYCRIMGYGWARNNFGNFPLPDHWISIDGEWAFSAETRRRYDDKSRLRSFIMDVHKIEHLKQLWNPVYVLGFDDYLLTLDPIKARHYRQADKIGRNDRGDANDQRPAYFYHWDQLQIISPRIVGGVEIYPLKPIKGS
jgi:hypothetical protein